MWQPNPYMCTLLKCKTHGAVVGRKTMTMIKTMKKVFFRLCLVGRNATALDEVASACKEAASPLVISVFNNIVFTEWQC